MTEQQLERWKDFAIRMARTCFKRRRNPSPKDIEANVQMFFDCLGPDDHLSIKNWDHSAPYPKTCKSYSRTYHVPCWHCHGAKKPKCPYACEDGHIYNYAHAPYVCDMCTELAEHWVPNYWGRMSDAEYERRRERFCDPVESCIRAGLDLAVSPSMGVTGFTAGDLRRMYPEGVPDWVTGGKKHRWTAQSFDGVVPGVGLVPGKKKLNGTFASMPDDAAVWL